MSVATSSPSMTLPGGTRFAAATTSGTSAVMSLSPRSFRWISPDSSRTSTQRRPSHLTSKRYSAELNGASADAACIGRTSSGKLSSSIWSWSECSSCTRPRLGAERLRSFTTSPGFGRRLLLAGALLLRLRDGLSQGLHQVHDLRRLRSLRGFDDLAFHLGAHDLHHRLAVLVLVARRVEALGQALDEGLCHLELLGVDLDLVLEAFQALGRADLVRPVEGVHDQALSVGVKGAEVLLVSQRDLGDGHAPGRLERALQQVVGLLAQLLGLDVVGAVVVQPRLDVIRGHELLDVDGVRGREGEVVQILVVDDDVAVLADLVAALDLAVGHLMVALGTPALVRDGRVVLRAQLAERDLGA